MRQRDFLKRSLLFDASEGRVFAFVNFDNQRTNRLTIPDFEMRVSFDSNAWERIFDAGEEFSTIVDALSGQQLEGFICEAGFRIEAVRKRDRSEYFDQPKSDFRFEGIVEREGQHFCKMSFGPNDEIHPGLPQRQRQKLRRAFASGVQLMRGLSWLGLPSPRETCDPSLFVTQTPEQASLRERRQIEVFEMVGARGVGKAAFDLAGGWQDLPPKPADTKKFWKACAEWSDGELVCAHVAYENEILCTDDRARVARTSIFNATNRSWLSREFGVRFLTLEELSALTKMPRPSAFS